MPDLAVLHTTLAEQLAHLGDATRYLRPLCVASSVDALQPLLNATPVHVVIADLALLGDAPRSTIDRLVSNGQAELGIVTYTFARRAVIQSLEAPHLRLLRSPVSLSVLRSSMAQLIAREIFHSDRPSSQPNLHAPSNGMPFPPLDLDRILHDIPTLIPDDAQALVPPLRGALTSLSDLKSTGARVALDAKLRALITEAERALDSLTQQTQHLRAPRGGHA